MASFQGDTFSNAAGSGAPAFSFGLTLPTTGGTPGTLDFYETYTNAIVNADLGPNSGGGTFNTTSGTLRVSRIGKLIMVTIDLTTTTASNVNGIIIQGTSIIPSRLRPTAAVSLGTYDVGIGGTGVFWRFNIATTGVITLSTRDNAGTNTTIANSTYTIGFCGSYTIA